MTETHTLTAELRERAGKGAARAVRRGGRVPAVIYGAGKAPLSISLEDAAIKREINRAGFLTTLFDVKVGSETERVLPRDIHFDPVTDWPLHVDFLRVSANTKVTVQVHVHFMNETKSPGLKRGGVLNIVRHEVGLICEADKIPDHLDCDLSGFDLGDSVHISHVKLPEGVELEIEDRDFTIATIATPSAVAAEQAEAQAAEAEGEGETEE
ncbi:large subunit ribosomal protein L25 [Tistlia consotensis]|uniref:Large ribosomal subunit protein bL25 n=1 Tax=Tistlia consotensis USBA 355 TaxID=560819 RepID=A0A1Y6C562_9PROT|nr:50S ribosomal protein L25/general stress protein Ctc [Tistlia consotensis]SMF46366.1 LSU ribosomal protein L25P [Tistlia consotensis USBA 355]SNR78536.1 large subunit ribosomal protein L25 [Tistlia consotensis]